MNLHWVDWGIVLLLLTALTALTLYTRRYIHGVADFLAANRLAGRYLLTVAQGLGGAISIIAAWEMLYASGLPTQWWSMMGIPVGLLLALTGFVIYRYRQTRALTLAQFFEVRYSRRFRLFAGMLSFIAGILNYGIFPLVTARFMIYFFGLPHVIHSPVGEISTFPVVMLLYLSFALFTVLAGGQISLMITDFFHGVLTLMIFVVLLVFLLHRFAWDDIIAGLQVAPAGKSMINPFDTANARDFNVWFFLIGIFGQIYNARSWQANSGFNAAAKTPHEAKMAGILGQLRSFAQQLCLLLIPLAAYAVMHHPKFAPLAGSILADVQRVSPDPEMQRQAMVPLFLTHVLPVGLMGLFASIIVAVAISCDNMYLHSWGSIFIQDVVLPLRKKPLAPRTHLLLLRLAIVGVAAFGFLYSLWFPLQDYILMYFAVTSAIYLGGAGAVIIGGLYWKRGTTLAAWVAMIAGSVLAFVGGLISHRQVWNENLGPWLSSQFPNWQWLGAHSHQFPISGQVMYFLAMFTASVLYVAVSLLGPRRVYDMDKLLHRGKYALPEDRLAGSVNQRRSFRDILGLSREFSRGERILFWATFAWSMGWWGIFVAGTVIHIVWGTSDAGWSWFWWFKIWLSFVLGVAVTVWFVYGGLRDVVQLFRDLRKTRADQQDDGSISPDQKSRVAAVEAEQPVAS